MRQCQMKLKIWFLFVLFFSFCYGNEYFNNITGFVNIKIPTGFSLICNPLDSEDNSIKNLFDPEKTGLSEGLIIYKFDNELQQYSINILEFGLWANPDELLEPGEGAFILNVGEETTITFTGNVRFGNLSQVVPSGFSLQSSQVPQTGEIDSDLNFPIEDGDIIYRYNNQIESYETYEYDFGMWFDEVFKPNVGESFWVLKLNTTNWNRTFTIY